MSDLNTPRLNKMPFWFADAMLLIAAATLVGVGARPLRLWEMLAVAGCVALGGWMAILPFLREYETATRLAETDRLAATTEKLGQLEELAGRIGGATSQWQAVQDRAGQTAELARDIVDRLAREAESFATAVSRTADADKQNLKLELDKLKRSEGEWLQAVGRIMDHVFALHLAAVRSGQPGVVDQLDRFHAACRDALRRIGFVPIVAAPGEPFDPRKHQAADESRPTEGARVDETVAPGFVYQGQLLRPVIVRWLAPEAAAAAEQARSTAGGSGNPGSVSALASASAVPAGDPSPRPASANEPVGHSGGRANSEAASEAEQGSA